MIFRNCFRVENQVVKVGSSMKYLGLTIDAKWNFKKHFSELLPRAERMASAVGRLMPNLGGPGERRRRLYASVVHSVILYDAPIWHKVIGKDRKIRDDLKRIQRRVALRFISAYRTVSYEAAMVLAGIVPIDLQVERAVRAYREYCEIRGVGAQIIPRVRAALRKREKERSVAGWKERLEEMTLDKPGNRVREALLPCFEKWLERGNRGNLTFRATQIITGHGCFQGFLFWINRADSPLCVLCASEIDTAQHTLEGCQYWGEARDRLRESVGQDLRVSVLGSVLEVALHDPAKWRAFLDYAERVMSTKETEERARQNIGARGRRSNRVRTG